ncbi:coiled-coil domain-containing protein [Thermoactinomyces mirandus]|uniref:Uncharacterized protein n=1 Tax=Thermoactinomyces mirandus TaxID=2756294 RepID=A0A7W1XUE3_9BACL|nr:hypothetical protein [Thermoactinomyces mirandus]MBA4603444.1 hypothetical protein [Thermoactinomyces mirandus]
MDKEIWTWILKNIPDEQLILLSKQIKVKIAGFRETSFRKNISLIKDKLVQQMVNNRNILKVKGVFNQWLNEHEEWIIFRSKKVEFLFEYVLIEKSKALLVLLSLVSSQNNDEYLTGIALYNQLKLSNRLNELEKIVSSFKDSEDKQKELEERIRKLELIINEKSKNLEMKKEKIRFLMEEQNNLKQTIESSQKESDETKQLLRKTLDELSNVKTNLEAKTCLINDLEEKNKNLKEELEKKESIIRSLDEKTPVLPSDLPQPNHKEKTVVLIGNELRRKIKNKLESHGFAVKICRDLENMNLCMDCDYIWLIEYQISTRLKRELQKLPCFGNITMIEDHLRLVELTDKLIKGEI